MKHRITALLLALVLLALASCAPTGTEKEDATKQPGPPNALETAPDDPSEIQTDPVDTPDTVRFDSKVGCSLDYDPIFFEAEEAVVTEGEEVADELQPIESVAHLIVQSIWKNGAFPVLVSVTPLSASSVEERVNDLCGGGMNLDRSHEMGVRNEVIREEVTFGSGHYPAIRLTYNEVYAVGEIYVTEQDGIVYEVEVSSYHRPPEKELALAYAILDSITF